ncbi:transcription factor bHLH30-like [Cynara cardunculus var. scolymus]|uniref:Myc-type, basic helix-loop-helix (BHLH) domain-containing protein n=1 Tax=Cynara cardunculus var. scolymus TaxID=59895 RepID=A0A103XV90_CYNCS|nr:transcription factor bHLH30-like [Cynara cardunculus var. scolymus]KVH97521.1 Myc-type, basic helix-loop-helix (bHLH) domain-containing protein [Cynara cardunculus var. scolymus]
MCAKREEEIVIEEGDHHHHQNIQRFQEQQLILQEIQQQSMGINDYSYSNTRLMFPSSSSSSEISPISNHHQQSSSWSTLPQVFHQNSNFNPLLQYPTRDHDPFLFPPPPPPPPPMSCYGGLFNRRVPGGLQFAYEGGTSSSDHHLRLISEMVQPGSGPFGLQTEMGKMTAQEIMDAKALAASKSHSEAERRRRERINNHLAKLRSLLPSTTKTDKASLLAEVIQHVKELKRQTSIIAEQSPVPTEIDELTVDNASDQDGKLVIRASLCCEDRSDLLPDLIKTLKALRLRTLKAEITTLGGRVKNVLFITAEDHNLNGNDDQQMVNYSINTIQEALKQVMEKTNGDDSSSGSVKRQRTNNINILEHHRSL